MQEQATPKTELYSIYMRAEKSRRLKLIEELRRMGVRYSLLSAYFRTVQAYKMPYPIAKVVLENFPEAEPLFQLPQN